MRFWLPTVSRAAAFARREALAVAALMGLALLVASFIEIADDVAEGDTLAIDRSVLLALREVGRASDPIGPAWLTTAAADLTSLGSIAVLTLVVMVMVGLFVSLGHRRQASIMLLASLGGLAWSESMKALFNRSRPEEIYRVVEAVNASFPSGHTILSASVYLTLGALVSSFATKRRVRAFALVTAIIVAVLVGLSRVFLGVHWASDVLGGWCLGGAWALACWLGLWLWNAGWRAGAAPPPPGGL